MKKIVALFAIVMTMASCGNGTSSTEVKADSTVVAVDSLKADSTVVVEDSVKVEAKEVK